VKIVVISEPAPAGAQVQYLVEGSGMTLSQHITGPIALAGATVALRLTGEPTTRIVAGYYSINGGAWTLLGQFAVPPEFFSQPPAVIDPQIGTATFGGIFATDRFLQGVALFKFDEFALLGPATPVVLDKKVYLPFILR
jgi:hypothetical protein